MWVWYLENPNPHVNASQCVIGLPEFAKQAQATEVINE
jgi:hypothetical protein